MPDEKPFDFALFTDAQLRELGRQVAAELGRRRAEAKRRRGLREGRGPRYRNPQNSAETWSGRGEPPAWVLAALSAGASLEELELTDNRPQRREPRDGRGRRRGSRG